MALHKFFINNGMCSFYSCLDISGFVFNKNEMKSSNHRFGMISNSENLKGSNKKFGQFQTKLKGSNKNVWPVSNSENLKGGMVENEG